MNIINSWNAYDVKKFKGLSTGITYIASLIIITDYFDKKLGIANGITMAGSGK